MKVQTTQTVLVCGLAVALLAGLPGFLRHMRTGDNPGLVLVNGRIEGTEVSVGTKQAGRVAQLLVDEGAEVKAGELIAALESEELKATCEQTRANVDQAKGNLQSAKEQVIRAEAELEKARIALSLAEEQVELGIKQSDLAVEEAKAAVAQTQAQLHIAETAYNHAQTLMKKDAASDLEFSNAKDQLDASKAGAEMVSRKLEQAEKAYQLSVSRKADIRIRQHDITVMESTVRQAHAAVGIAEAQVKSAEALARIAQVSLDDTKIYAPCSGVVVSRVVEPGEVIDAGTTLAVIVDFDHLYLKAYLPTTMINSVSLNTPAKIYIDGCAEAFDGRVTKTNKQAEFTPKNVDTPQQRVKLVFGLEITVANPDRKIKPGVPADGVVRIDPQAEWKTPDDLR
jgi:HlyD family secretion protein